MLETYTYFDDFNPPTTLRESGSVKTSYVPTLAEDTTYFWKVNLRHADGTETGIVRSFTTSGSPPPVAAAAGFRMSVKGGTIKFHPAGVLIKR